MRVISECGVTIHYIVFIKTCWPNANSSFEIVFGTNAQAIEKTSTDGDAPLPVTVFGSNPNPGTFYILQNWNSATSTIRLSTITGDIPAASWNTSSAVFPSGGSAYNTSPGEIVEQVGEPRKLSTNDARISSGVMVNGKIWCAHHVGMGEPEGPVVAPVPAPNEDPTHDDANDEFYQQALVLDRVFSESSVSPHMREMLQRMRWARTAAGVRRASHRSSLKPV